MGKAENSEDGGASRATLAHVAERAGVSLKTASRALGGESYVSESTRDRVLAAARDLDYQRNTAASLLASGRLADSIGLVTGDFTNPFYSALAQAIEDEIRPHSIHLSVANSRESADQEWLVVHDLADRQTKALIVVSAMPEHGVYQQLQARGIPVVFIDRPSEDVNADSVVFDNREGGRIAGRHLRQAGHTRIAFIGDYHWLPTFRARLAGLGDVLDDTDAAEWRDLVRADTHDVSAARERTAELLALPEPPTAIIAGNNRILLGVMEELTAMHPERRPAILGIDDVEWARVLGISVVTGDTEQLGRQAARLALGRLADRMGASEHTVLPMKLIARGSAETPPAP
ncbi:LacI family DNA-binding transcriptional regulator [Microbacterium sp.]|uniref:LacI family DNA-binding transcriptional regulator n=1 Tax=Microbacterium sp. TaxID=51671 RepID=UPI00261C6468|nr:LacI family DNA-binding transcriptional regulator [Microbacterium sp.]